MTKQSTKTTTAPEPTVQVLVIPLRESDYHQARSQTIQFLQGLDAGILDYIFEQFDGVENFYLSLEELEMNFTSQHFGCASDEDVLAALHLIKMVKQFIKPTPLNVELASTGQRAFVANQQGDVIEVN